jgi:hypothetical protein
MTNKEQLNQNLTVRTFTPELAQKYAADICQALDQIP